MEPNDNRGATEKRSRVEDEIIEILNRTDRPVSFSDHLRRRASRQRRARLEQFVSRATAGLSRLGGGAWLIGCVAAALLAVVVEGSSPFLARLLAVVSVAMLIIPIVQGIRRPRQPGPQMWRGREVHYGSDRPAWIESLRQRFKRPPRL